MPNKYDTRYPKDTLETDTKNAGLQREGPCRKGLTGDK